MVVCGNHEDILQRIALRKAAGEESRRRWAQGGPCFQSLLPYLDEVRYGDVLKRRERANELLHRASAPTDVAGATVWLDRFQALLSLDHEILGLFAELRGRIETALDGCADTCADTVRKLVRVTPQDDRVLLLYFKILSNDDPTKPQSVIAKEFTEMHEGDPDSLLRAVRRLRERRRRLEELKSGADTEVVAPL